MAAEAEEGLHFVCVTWTLALYCTAIAPKALAQAPEALVRAPWVRCRVSRSGIKAHDNDDALDSDQDHDDDAAAAAAAAAAVAVAAADLKRVTEVGTVALPELPRRPARVVVVALRSTERNRGRGRAERQAIQISRPAACERGAFGACWPASPPFLYARGCGNRNEMANKGPQIYDCLGAFIKLEAKKETLNAVSKPGKTPLFERF